MQQGNDAYQLVVRRGPQPNQAFPLTGDVTNIGRDITNDIVINDREASRHHMRLMRGADGYTIEDLGSTNGTFVNGKRITGATALKQGDMVGMGETVTIQFDRVRPDGSVSPDPAADVPQVTAPSAGVYEPPAQQRVPQQSQPAPQQADPNPYQQPAPSYEEPAPADTYQQSNGGYDYSAPASNYGGSPPPPGYDYDPYAIREEEGRSMSEWFLIGCLGLLLVCCCSSLILAVLIDSYCWYDSVPFVTNIIGSFGYVPQC